jgi:membrane-bound lytic murein transglycosylase B
MKRITYFIKITTISCFLVPGSWLLGAAQAAEKDVNRWNTVLQEIQDRAIAENISPIVIDEVIQEATFMAGVIRSDQNQAEFRLTLNQYLTRMINADRVRKGRAMKTRHAALLRQVEQRYGVQPHVILAFWGLESNYGSFKSTHRMSDAFLTLIYDGRRKTFFTNQLFALMRHADKNGLSMSYLRGSWAGAMGHFQFIPTTLAAYGVDGDGDGKIDVIGSLPDAMHSAGNFLRRLGWNKNERILRTVRLPAGFDMSLCDARTRKQLSRWAAMGVRNPDGSAIPRANMSAGMVCDARDNNNVGYLVYDNFYRIKRWNNSNAYAIAVGLLAVRLRD